MFVIGMLLNSNCGLLRGPASSAAVDQREEDRVAQARVALGIAKIEYVGRNQSVRELAATVTSSQVFASCPTGQINSTRSEPLTPAPERTNTVAGNGATAHWPGELLLPTLNVKSLAVIEPTPLAPNKSTITPVMPRE